MSPVSHFIEVSLVHELHAGLRLEGLLKLGLNQAGEKHGPSLEYKKQVLNMPHNLLKE